MPRSTSFVCRDISSVLLVAKLVKQWPGDAMRFARGLQKRAVIRTENFSRRVKEKLG